MEKTKPWELLSPADAALSNYVILQKIFSYLSSNYMDVVNCCKVSKIWESVIESMSSNLCLYRVKLQDEYPEIGGRSVKMVMANVEQIFGINKNSSTCKVSRMFTTDLPNLKKIFRVEGEKYVISIDLEISSALFKNYLSVLKEFGHKVHAFYWHHHTYYLSRFLHHLKHLPELRVLKWDKIFLADEDLYSEGNNDCYWISPVPEQMPALPYLERIYFGDLCLKAVSANFLDMYCKILRLSFANLREMLEVPLECLGIISQVFGHLNGVKSLYPSNAVDIQEFDLRALPKYFQNIADERVQLINLEIPETGRFQKKRRPGFRATALRYNLTRKIVERLYRVSQISEGIINWKAASSGPPRDSAEDSTGRDKLIKKIQKEFCNVLKLSQNSAWILTIGPTEAFSGYLPLPYPLAAAKVLRLKMAGSAVLKCSEDTRWQTWEEQMSKNERIYVKKMCVDYFPRTLDLFGMLPSLEALEINDNLYLEDLEGYFPKEIFSSRGFEIKFLKVKGVSPNCFHNMVEMFPCLEHLEIESALEHFPMVFPTIAKGLLELRSLTIHMGFSGGFRFKTIGCENYHGWDSVLSGIPEDLCRVLNEAEPNKDDKFEEEIQIRQDNSVSLFNLTHLKRMEFLIHGEAFPCENCRDDHVPKVMSSVLAKHVLSVLPNLEMIVGVVGGNDHTWINNLKLSLSPVADYIDISYRGEIPKIFF